MKNSWDHYNLSTATQYFANLNTNFSRLEFIKPCLADDFCCSEHLRLRQVGGIYGRC